MLAAHHAVTTICRKAQQKLGKLVSQGRHAAHTVSLEQLAETVRPPGPGNPLDVSETKEFGKARHRSMQGGGDTEFLRARPTGSLCVISAPEFVGMRRRFIGIEEHAGVTYPCCDEVNVDTRHARICPTAGAQVNQHQALRPISHTLKPLGILHQVKRSEPFTADTNLPMGNVIRRGGLREAPNRDKSILLDVIHADPQAKVHLRGGSADHDGSHACTSESHKGQHYARPRHTSFGERSHKFAALAAESLGRLGVEGNNCIDQLAASVVGGTEG